MILVTIYIEDFSIEGLSKIVKDLSSGKERVDLPDKIRNLLDAIKIPEIKEVPNLPIYDLRDLTVQEGNVIEKYLKVKYIKDLAKVKYNQVAENLFFIEEAGIQNKKLELLITAAKYII